MMRSDYDPRVQWAAVAVILLLVGGIIAASMYSGNETQIASNRSAVETTGSASPIPVAPPASRQ
jgi:hypothetical protein